MIINTKKPLTQNKTGITKKIAIFWDQISEGWRKVWGPHIHHGFYENNETLTPFDAQVKLIEKLTDLLKIVPQYRILDAGSGLGGSSIFLAKKFQTEVIGITLSKQQVIMAKEQARLENMSNVTFKVEDALSLSSFQDNSFDIVWSLESCEQFYDKNLFINQALRVLKPGGQLMIATWCSDRDEYEGVLAKKYINLCKAFDLPYMPTMEHYSTLLTANKFTLQLAEDWSRYVNKSWDIGVSLVNGYSIFQLLKMAGWRGFRFAHQIKMMQEAFRYNRVRYGVFVAIK